MPRWASGPVGQPAYWQEACAQLAAADPAMAALCARYKGEGLVGQGDPFLTLARAIVAQQISVRAADSIWARLEACVETVSPPHVAARSEEDLRGAGLTRRKAGYLRDIALGFVEGRIDPEGWRAADDEAAIADLLTLRGVGRWTAEMVLIFHLQRPDVLPLGDIGVRRAVARLYGDGGATTMGADAVEAHARPWRPWRTVAVWHLWRSLDPHPVAY